MRRHPVHGEPPGAVVGHDRRGCRAQSAGLQQLGIRNQRHRRVLWPQFEANWCVAAADDFARPPFSFSYGASRTLSTALSVRSSRQGQHRTNDMAFVSIAPPTAAPTTHGHDEHVEKRAKPTCPRCRAWLKAKHGDPVIQVAGSNPATF